jgi:hypothetical protein
VSVEQGWEQGPPELLSSIDEQQLFLSRRADYKALPPEMFGWLGQDVTLFDTQNAVCTTKIEKLSLRGSLFILDRGAPFGNDLIETPLNEEMVQELWTSSGVLLVAELSPNEECKGADFARPSYLPEPMQLVAENAPETIALATISALRSLPEYKEIQKSYDEQPVYDSDDPISARWEDSNEYSTNISLFKTPHGEMFVSGSFFVGEGGCGDFQGELWGLWKVSGNEARPVLTLLSDGAEGLPDPRMLIDINNDGQWEMFESETLYQSQDESYRITEQIAYPYDRYECGC